LAHTITMLFSTTLTVHSPDARRLMVELGGWNEDEARQRFF
jgi:hypothetical protein